MPLIFSSCAGNKKTNNQSVDSIAVSDTALFRLVQEKTFQYFWDGAEPNSGLARERFHVDNDYPDNDKNVVTSGGSGFGVMAILVGIERGFITRAQAVDRFEKIGAPQASKSVIAGGEDALKALEVAEQINALIKANLERFGGTIHG